MKKIFLIFSCLFCVKMLLLAQVDFKIGGEFRVRSELDGRDFLNKTYPQSFTASRIRLNIEKTIFNNVTIFLQLQDSRVFGQEKGTLSDLQNIDLHQGYIKIENIFDLPFSLHLGRFELNYGRNKIFGPNLWHNVGRSYDGFKLSLKDKFYQVDGFLAVHNNFLNYRAGAADNYQNYNYIDPPADTGFNIYGLYSLFKFTDFSSLDIYYYYEWDRSRPNGKDKKLSRITSGLAYSLVHIPFEFYIEGAFQSGRIFYKQIDKLLDVSSFLLLSSISYKILDFKFSLNADITSGGDPTKSGNYRLFDNPFSTKHNYQGYMDFFTKLSDPNFSEGIFGLQDYFLGMSYIPKDSKFIGELFVHYFKPFQMISILDAPSNFNDAKSYGTELDVVVNYLLFPSVKLEWGGGIFIPEKAMKLVYSQLPKRKTIERFDPAFWTYFQIKVGF